MTYYFLERVLDKISLSEEKHNFIFKVGFILSSLIGIENRTTVDIDIAIKNFELEESVLIHKLKRILNADKYIKYEIKNISEIRNDDEYGGYRVSILCRLENIKQLIPLDIATGDPITPSAINYSYKSIFNDKEYPILTYNIETMLAEKIETLYKRGPFNSRSKDFYDLFILYKLKKDDIDFETLKTALKNTFEYRNTELNYGKIEDVIKELKKEQIVIKRWENYSKQYSFAKELSFLEIMDTIDNLINKLK